MNMNGTCYKLVQFLHSEFTGLAYLPLSFYASLHWHIQDEILIRQQKLHVALCTLLHCVPTGLSIIARNVEGGAFTSFKKWRKLQDSKHQNCLYSVYSCGDSRASHCTAQSCLGLLFCSFLISTLRIQELYCNASGHDRRKLHITVSLSKLISCAFFELCMNVNECTHNSRLGSLFIFFNDTELKKPRAYQTSNDINS